MPPSPVVTTLRGWNERVATSASAPQAVPPSDEPSAQAASSMTGQPASAAMPARSAGTPNWSTAMTALVRALMTAAIVRGLTFQVSGSTSANTGVAPSAATTFAGAGNVRAGTTT